LNVKNRAEAVATYRKVNVHLMESLAAWVPSTPEMELKILFGRHLWLVAQLADRLGRRTRELRAPLHHNREPQAEFARALATLAALRPSASRLHGLYEIALPAVAAEYDRYIAATDAVIDEPTVVILQDGMRDIERMRAEAARLPAEFPALGAAQGRDCAEVARLLAQAPTMVAPGTEILTEAS
jgi:hypothetical protein